MSVTGGKLADSCAVIAHRGASRIAPENTIAAFRAAVEQGADALEFDVQLTSDRQPVVIHDARLERTTNGSGSVRNCSYKDIIELDAGSHFSRAYAEERVPHLEEVLWTFRGELRMNIELKGVFPESHLITKTYSLIRRCSLEGDVVVSSFNPILLMMAYRYDPEIALGLLISRDPGKLPGYILRRIVRYSALHPGNSLVTEEMIETQHDHGHAVNTWTVDDEAQILRFYRWGIDGIITNYPGTAHRILHGC